MPCVTLPPPSLPHPECLQNPLAYGIPWEEVASDPALEGHRRKLITEAARELERSKMARFDERSGNLYVTGKQALLGIGERVGCWASTRMGCGLRISKQCQRCCQNCRIPSCYRHCCRCSHDLLLAAELGRVASHYYIRHSSIVVFNEHLKPHMGEADILAMIALSSGGCGLLLAGSFCLACWGGTLELADALAKQCPPQLSSVTHCSTPALLTPCHPPSRCSAPFLAAQSLRTWLCGMRSCLSWTRS